jgi:hypothetical protein
MPSTRDEVSAGRYILHLNFHLVKLIRIGLSCMTLKVMQIVKKAVFKTACTVPFKMDGRTGFECLPPRTRRLYCRLARWAKVVKKNNTEYYFG